MNLLNKLTIKNLKLNKKRTIVTIIGIMLSVALITAVSSIYTSGIKSLIKFEIKENGNYHVAYRNVLKKDLDLFENNRSIEKINITHDIGYATINSKNEYKPYAFIKAYTKESLKNLSVVLVEGRLPKNESEILIPTHLKTNGRVFFKVGDTLTLNVGRRVNSENEILSQEDSYQISNNEQIVNSTIKKYKIVGIMERPPKSIEGYSAAGYTFITYIDEKNINGAVDIYTRYTKNGSKDWAKVTANIIGVDEDLFTRYYSNSLNMSESDFEKIDKQLEKAKYNIDTNEYLIELEASPFESSSIKKLFAVIVVVLGIIVFTSVFCIKNSFDISISKKTKQYGMLRSIGATKKQIRKNVFYESTILGIIGIPLGILLGLLASYLLVIISNCFFSDSITDGFKLVFGISLISIIISIILGIITIYFSAFRSAKKASKVSPIDSIRNSANIKIDSKKIRSPKIIKKIFGMGGEISFKNLKRNKKKYRTTVISIVVSVFCFIALSSFVGNAFDVVKNNLKISEYNVTLVPSSIYDEDEEKYDRFLKTTKLENVDDYTVLRYVGLEVNDMKYNPEYIKIRKPSQEQFEKNDNNVYLNIYALGEEQYKKYIKSLGLKYENIKDKMIIMDYSKVGVYKENKDRIDYKKIRVFDYQVNEKVKGKLDGKKEISIEVGFITDKKPFGLKNTDLQFAIVSDEFYNKINNSSKSIQIYYKSNDADKLQDEIDDLLNGETYTLLNREEDVRSMNSFITLIGIFLYGFIIVISLIGITNIFNTITTNMELRKQEFAMLKSVGMTSKEFNRMIRLETLFMGVKALVFGLPIGIGLSYAIYNIFAKNSGLSYRLPLLAIIISIVVVFILISLIMKYSMNKINKQNTIETIRNENI